MKNSYDSRFMDDISLSEIISNNRYLVGLKPANSCLFLKEELNKPKEEVTKPFDFDGKKYKTEK